MSYVDIGVENEGGGSIDLLVVDEAHRGRGVGNRLVEDALAWLRSEGVDLVFVAADQDAVEFYEAMGFMRTTGPWLVRGGF